MPASAKRTMDDASLAQSPPSPSKALKLSSSPPSPVSSFNPKSRRTSFGSAVNGKSGLGSSEVKRLVIKSNRTRPAVTTDFSTQSLSVFTRAVRAITAVPPEPIPESLETLYTLCQGLLSGPGAPQMGQTLYDRIRIEVERRVGEIARRLRAPIEEADEAAAAESWLRRLELEWKRFLDQMVHLRARAGLTAQLMVRSVFLHLDRTFVLHRPSLLSIWDLGLDIFRSSVVEGADLAERIASTILLFIDRERRGLLAPRPLVTAVVTLLRSLSTSAFVEVLERPFLSASRSFFAAEGAERVGALALSASQASTADYMRHIDGRLVEESQRVEAVMGDDTGLKGQILRVVEDNLIRTHVAELLARGLEPMLVATATDDARAKDDLATMYRLLARVGALSQLRSAFSDWIKSTGSAYLTDTANDETMVQFLLDFKSRVDRLVAGPFIRDSDFAQAGRVAFETFVNKRQNKPAEMFAKYLDGKMRGGARGLTDDELERTFDEVLAIFRYTQGKDVFEAWYMRLFAKRLLLNKSASSDMEKVMLVKLRAESGAAFTSKLETMAKDIDLSTDLMTAFKSHRAATGDSGADPFDLSVNVLTSGNWPSLPSHTCALPAAMVASLDRFKRFYASKFSGRTLTWQHALHQCTLRAQFPKGGRKELSVSLFQTLYLLPFNELADPDDRISFADLLARTKLDKVEAARTLQSLACGKVRVLTKHPKGRDIGDNDEFSINVDFKAEHYRVKINQLQSKATDEETKQTNEHVFLERKLVLEACIVRILKSRKQIKHNELLMEIVSQLASRFKVEPVEVKRSIDSLIERDYMERDESDRSLYRYLA